MRSSSVAPQDVPLGFPDPLAVCLSLYECSWLASCSTVRVVLPTVPETPGHNPQPRVCRHSDANHKMPGVVRRQTAGAAAFGSGQAVRVGLAAARGACWPVYEPGTPASDIPPIAHTHISVRRRVCMARHLRHAQRRVPHSAGNTRPPPPTPRLPPLRCGSHTARRSTEADCWPS